LDREEITLEIIPIDDQSVKIELRDVDQKELYRVASRVEDYLENYGFSEEKDKILSDMVSSKTFEEKRSALMNNMDCKIFIHNKIVCVFASNNRLATVKDKVLDKLKKLPSIPYVSKKFDIEYPDLITTNEPEFLDFKAYLALGEQLKHSNEVKEFTHLINSIYSRTNPFSEQSDPNGWSA
jgi:hypothetical protein